MVGVLNAAAESTQPVARKLRQTLRVRKHIAAPGVLYRMMYMPARGRDVRQLWSAHEARQIPGAREYLLCCAAKQQHQIGWLHAGSAPTVTSTWLGSNSISKERSGRP